MCDLTDQLPALAESCDRRVVGHPAVGEETDAPQGSIGDARRGQLGLGVGRDPDRARLLDRLRLEREVAELIEPALVAHVVLGPQPSQDRYALLEAWATVDQLHLEGGELRLGLLSR